MKKIFPLFLIGLLVLSCSNNDNNGIDCSLFDPAFPSLNIRVVNTSGINLIENGTIDPNNISVEGNFVGAGFQYIPVNEFANPDAEIREFDNSLSLFIPNESTFQYIIHLDDTETINVDFTAELTRIPCGLTYFIPTKADLNNEKLELKEISSLQFLVVIEI